MVRKISKILIFSILAVCIFFFVGCKSRKVKLADPVVKQTLFKYYTDLKQLRNTVLAIDDEQNLLYGQSYIAKDLDDKLTKGLTDSIALLEKQDATADEVSNLLGTIKRLASEIKSSIITGKKIVGKDSYLVSLSLLDTGNLPDSYKLFYNQYATEKIATLKSLSDFSFEDYNVTRTILQDLISFMQEDTKGLAKPSVDLDYCTRKNPFVACRPKLDAESLPTQQVLTDNIGEVKNYLADVRATDFTGASISSKVYFKQVADRNQVFTRQFQIAAIDDWGNEVVSDKIYTIVNSSLTSTPPQIVVPKLKEVVSKGKLENFDLRDFVLATDYYGVRIPNDHIDFNVYNADGSMAIDFNETKRPGNYFIYFTARDFYGHVSEMVKKEIIVTPPSEDFYSHKERILASNMVDSPVFTISEIEKLSEFDNPNSKLYYRFGTNMPLASRKLYQNVSPRAKDRGIILIDNIDQYLDGKYQFDGFHNMSYDLYPYLEAVVYKNGRGNIQIPERRVINQFHKNGVKVYGYITIPFAHLGGQVKDLETLFAKSAVGFTHLNILKSLPAKLGFDGWCIDIQTPFYEYNQNYKTLAMAKQKEYLASVEAAKTKMIDFVIPFLTELNASDKDLVMVAGINDSGTITESSRYTSNDYKQISKIVDKFITSPFNKLGEIKLVEEQQKFQDDNQSSNIKKSFYKGVIANHTNKGDVTLNDFLSLLDTDDTLISSLGLFDLSSRLFSIKLYANNYQKLDPTSPNNYYGSNDYHKYFKRLQDFIYPDRVDSNSASIARQVQGENTTVDSYFGLGEYITPLVLDSQNFYSSLSSLNGYKHFSLGVEDGDFTKRKTFFIGGGTNNPDVQTAPLTWTKYNSSPSIIIAPDFVTPTENGFSSVKVRGKFAESSLSSEINLWALEQGASSTTSLYAGIKVNNAAGLSTDYTLQFKVYYLAQDNSLKSTVISNQLQASSLVANYHIKKENDNFDTSDIKKITRVTLIVTYQTSNDSNYEFNLMYFYLGDKKLDIASPSEITNITFNNDKGLTNNIICNGFLQIGPFSNEVSKDHQYYIYQEKSDGSKVYLTQSYHSNIYLENILRYATNPVNPQFPTLDEYDKKGKIVVEKKLLDGRVEAKGSVSFDWPNELVAGGYAKVRLSSKIAQVNEAITITPIIDELTQSVEFDFTNQPCEARKIPGTEAYVVKFYKEGFYGFTYKTINPYGTDSLEIKYGITISNVIEKEADITGDATIDDSEEMAGIKYSNFVNNAERPRYLIDTDKDGNRNLGTKWCSNDKSPGMRWVIIDFKDKVTITRFELAHCASSLTNSFDKGSVQFNSREYEILVSLDGVNWKRVVHRENNYKTFTTDILEEPVEAKHIKLNIINGGDDVTARVYDMRIYGSR